MINHSLVWLQDIIIFAKTGSRALTSRVGKPRALVSPSTVPAVVAAGRLSATLDVFWVIRAERFGMRFSPRFLACCSTDADTRSAVSLARSVDGRLDSACCQEDDRDKGSEIREMHDA